MVDDYIEALHVLLRETLLKKGFPSNSLPKTFRSVFSARGTPLKEKTELFCFICGTPCRKNKVGSLWKGVWGRTFLQKGLPQ
ncbi:MAG: hypothetical protein IKP42_09090 [Ruminococcus sp.]|nr:hypothetical protein [Ruminococcus sp.]